MKISHSETTNSMANDFPSENRNTSNDKSLHRMIACGRKLVWSLACRNKVASSRHVV